MSTCSCRSSAQNKCHALNKGVGGQHLCYYSRRPVMIMHFTLQPQCKTVEPLVKLHENQSNVNATKDCPWQRVVGMAAGHRAP